MKKALLVAALAATTGSASAITLEFDYTYANGFFSDDHVAVINAVASEFGTRLTDSLAAIESNGVNSYRAAIGSLGATTVLTDPLSVPEDTITIFLGARELTGSTLAIGGSGYSVSGTQAFVDLIDNRGQAASPDVDFAPVTGAIVFDTRVSTTWYLDDDVSTVESFAGNDFYSVLVHEVAHVLGVGTSDAWNNLISGSTFTGETATEVNGGAVTLADSGHLSQSLLSSFMGQVQTPSLTPTITTGTRKYMTDLDWALLADIGWEVQPVSAVPEAHTWAMMIAGLAVLGWRRRRA